MKTLKLRTTAESEKFWAESSLDSYTKVLLCQGDERNAFLEKYPKRGYHVSGYTAVSNFNDEFIQKTNHWVTKEIAYSVVSTLTMDLKEGEATLFPRFLLNSFLGTENEDLTYGEFIQENWDRVKLAMDSMVIEENAYTKLLFARSMPQKSLLLVKPNARKESLEAVYGLTLAQVKALIKVSTHGELLVKASVIPERVKALLALVNGETLTLPARKDVQLQLNKAFVGAFAHETDKSIAQLEEANIAFAKELRAVARKSYDNPADVNAGMGSTGDTFPVAKWLAENSHELRFYEVFALTHALHNPQAMVKLGAGKSASLAPLFHKAVAKPDALTLMRLFVDAMILSKNEFPTIDEWNAGMDDGTLSTALNSDIAIALISGSTKRFSTNPDANEMRRTLRYFHNN